MRFFLAFHLVEFVVRRRRAWDLILSFLSWDACTEAKNDDDENIRRIFSTEKKFAFLKVFLAIINFSFALLQFPAEYFVGIHQPLESTEKVHFLMFSWSSSYAVAKGSVFQHEN